MSEMSNVASIVTDDQTVTVSLSAAQVSPFCAATAAVGS
jgi:hypothetical protein